MTGKELDEWGVDFRRFCARFADVFGRKEPREQAIEYLRGLLPSVPCKNSWQVAEAVGDRSTMTKYFHWRLVKQVRKAATNWHSWSEGHTIGLGMARPRDNGFGKLYYPRSGRARLFQVLLKCKDSEIC